ncbi:hypothetical protein FRX31_021576 [Thalictrum thalictroides]|uniref:Uncharacterized protein n=1 Tax=Thalictrum thalictroides TaxID=46969 RepID=A0A7J6VVW1_THATH|nr:hypothetical protein FRX31_021576 [Thalictrum thalictroides]
MAIHKHCHGSNGETDDCYTARDQGYVERGDIHIYNIYAPLCHDSEFSSKGSTGSSVSNTEKHKFRTFCGCCMPFL